MSEDLEIADLQKDLTGDPEVYEGICPKLIEERVLLLTFNKEDTIMKSISKHIAILRLHSERKKIKKEMKTVALDYLSLKRRLESIDEAEKQLEAKLPDDKDDSNSRRQLLWLHANTTMCYDNCLIY